MEKLSAPDGIRSQFVVALYRCRRCGAEFDGGKYMLSLVDVEMKLRSINYGSGLVGAEGPKHIIFAGHTCDSEKPGEIGVADLIGAREEK